jgi:hypothetical protein
MAGSPVIPFEPFAPFVDGGVRPIICSTVTPVAARGAPPSAPRIGPRFPSRAAAASAARRCPPALSASAPPPPSAPTVQPSPHRRPRPKCRAYRAYIAAACSLNISAALPWAILATQGHTEESARSWSIRSKKRTATRCRSSAANSGGPPRHKCRHRAANRSSTWAQSRSQRRRLSASVAAVAVNVATIHSATMGSAPSKSQRTRSPAVVGQGHQHRGRRRLSRRRRDRPPSPRGDRNRWDTTITDTAGYLAHRD